ncbi:MAG: YCF48-related protein [Ignavibacteria bacterium]|jgi:photosystem II stability/assembly factor-like uncharacterized protein|nr:YCF48-related protein [Ignavibacteria bacterium]
MKIKLMLKYYLLAVLFVIPGISSSQEYWLNANSPTTLSIHKASFIDSTTGWICGDSGMIMRTTNGGLNWASQNSGINSTITNIYFYNKRLGWAFSWKIYAPPYGTLILRTTNGGINWDSASYPVEDVFLKAIIFQDSLNGFMGGNGHNLLRSTNGGANWLLCAIDSSMVSGFPVLEFTFLNNDFGYAAGGVMDIAGVVWRTTNRGIRWTPYIVSPEPIIKTFLFDSLNILGFGGDFEYGPSTIRSSNSGANWKYITLEFFGAPTDIEFRTKNEAWASLGYSQTFIYTLDTGETWTQINTPDSNEINDIVFTDERHGWAFCNYGKILKFNYAAVNISEPGEIITGFELFQNYPNPFNPSTTILYNLSAPGHVLLKVYDINGKEIEILADGVQKGGMHSVNFSGYNLPSGVYFYVLSVQDIYGNIGNSFKKSKKMVLIK